MSTVIIKYVAITKIAKDTEEEANDRDLIEEHLKLGLGDDTKLLDFEIIRVRPGDRLEVEDPEIDHLMDDNYWRVVK